MKFRSSALVSLIAVPICFGCESRPRAPKLVNESIYQNDDAGFRIEIPDGWSMHVKTLLPPGQPALKERKLVGYKLHLSAVPASLEISCMDLPEDADLVAYFTGNRTGPEAWRVLQKPAEFNLGGVAARRLVLELGSGADAQRKEVAAVRRGTRTFFFTTITSPRDVESRDAVRAALDRISCKPS